MKARLRAAGLHSVCEEARCPNRGHCFARGTATFLLLGDRCTRNCGFCAIGHGVPAPPDPEEPQAIARTVASLDLRYVVLTSVTRDDLSDGGAGHFARSIRAIRDLRPGVGIEVLTPDFQGSRAALETVLEAEPAVFNHNLETVPRLYPGVRPGADFARSLGLLEAAGGRVTKTGLMLGLGETREELLDVFGILLDAGVRRLTLGQYLRPTLAQLPVEAYLPPEVFERLGEQAREMGFERVQSAPLVRSSFEAGGDSANPAGCP